MLFSAFRTKLRAAPHKENSAIQQGVSFWETEKKLEMLGSIVWRLASPRKILGEKKNWGEIFFEHSGWHETSQNAEKKWKWEKFFWRWKKIFDEKKIWGEKKFWTIYIP